MKTESAFSGLPDDQPSDQWIDGYIKGCNDYGPAAQAQGDDTPKPGPDQHQDPT